MSVDLVQQKNMNTVFKQTVLTADDQKQFMDWVAKFNVPKNRGAALLFKAVILLEFTIVGSILWVPWSISRSTAYIVLFCLLVDFLRVSINGAIRTLVFGGRRVLGHFYRKFDDSFRTDYFGIAFLGAYVIAILGAVLLSKCFRIFPALIINLFENFQDVRSLTTYGFHSVHYRQFSFLFLYFVHTISFVYLLFVSSVTLQLYDFRSLFFTKKLYIGEKSSPFNVSRSLTVIPMIICFVLGLHAVLAPSLMIVSRNKFDWAGPIAMLMYALCEWSVISMVQIYNRYVIIPVQARYATPY